MEQECERGLADGWVPDVVPAADRDGAGVALDEELADRLVPHVEGILAELETMVADDAGARLRHVAQRSTAACRAAGWWISRVEDTGLVTRWIDWRTDAQPAGRPGLPELGPGIAVDEHVVPDAARDFLLERMDGGSCLARPGDATGLGEWLPAAGLGAAVVAGGHDYDARQWVVAVLLESATGGAVTRLALTSVVQAALALPPPRRR